MPPQKSRKKAKVPVYTTTPMSQYFYNVNVPVYVPERQCPSICTKTSLYVDFPDVLPKAGDGPQDPRWPRPPILSKKKTGKTLKKQLGPVLPHRPAPFTNKLSQKIK